MLSDIESELRSELADAGSEDEFWARVERSGTPRVDEVDDRLVRLALLHRQAPGSDPSCVYVDASSLTDHHAAELTTMTRLDNTGIWFWSTVVARTWRGSYRFMPVNSAIVDELDPPGIADTVDGIRSRFLGLREHAVADEFNPHELVRASLAEMPDAPPQRWWNEIRSPHSEPRKLKWDSSALGIARDVWIHETPGDADPSDRPLVLILDGRQWVDEFPLTAVLDRATTEGHLPPSVLMFVDSLDSEVRGRELPCNRQFWEAVTGELLPLAAEHATFTADPRRTVTAGQSYGGLASVFAALEFPERFGLVSSQSGSFWWPTMMIGDTHGPVGGHVAEILDAEKDDAAKDDAEPNMGEITVDMTVGIHEGHMPMHNRHIATMLRDRGVDVRYAEFDGGHEWICWRGELVESLIRLLDSDSPARTRVRDNP